MRSCRFASVDTIVYRATAKESEHGLDAQISGHTVTFVNDVFGDSRDGTDYFHALKRACAALSIDMTNPCGAHGYAVESKISTTLNTATRKCYEFGGKECVIRAWACDAKG